MRNIEFRAKAKNKNKWVYGDLLHPEHNDNSYSIFEFGGGCVKIRPETLGQYTGLKDKNGTKIFEGDIVKAKYKEIRDYMGIKYDDSMEFIEKIIWSKDYNGFCLELNCCGMTMYRRLNFCEEVNDIKLNELEVVGNIFDNPELLKEGEDDNL